MVRVDASWSFTARQPRTMWVHKHDARQFATTDHEPGVSFEILLEGDVNSPFVPHPRYTSCLVSLDGDHHSEPLVKAQRRSVARSPPQGRRSDRQAGHSTHDCGGVEGRRASRREAMVLTDKQRMDLHQSMLDYLHGMGDRFAETAAAFEKEAGVARSGDGKHAGLLEKKWTSVIRLQRKIMELESKVKQLEESAKLGGVVSRRDVVGGGRSKAEFLPRAPPKYSLSGHRNPITCVAFHPVFSVFVSGSEDATVKVWDFETGEYERTLKGHTNHVQAVAFNSQGSLLASASADLTIKVWDFSSDGDYECLKTLRGHDHNVCGLVFAPTEDSDRLYSCSRDHSIKVWEISTGYCLHTMNNGHADWVRDIAVSDDGMYLASCGNDRSVLFWELQNMRVLQSLREHEHVVESVAFAKSGPQEQAIEKFHAQKLANAVGSGEDTNGSAPESSLILSSGARRVKFILSGSRDRSVRLWEAFSGAMLMNFSSHENWVRCVRFHPSGRYVVSVAEDKTLRVFDIETGRCVRTIDEAHGHFLTSLDVHSTLPLMLTGSIDKQINVWECG